MTHPSTEASRRRQALREAARRPAQRPAALRRSLTLAGSAKIAPTPSTASHDVFISYSHANRPIIDTLAVDLASRNIKAWWDYEILGGQHFRRTILDALNAARAVIVVWSEASANSRYVLDEAERAFHSGKLVPTYVDGFNPEQIPLGFGGLQTIPIGDRDRLLMSLKPLLNSGTAERSRHF
jgi:hypothetical protein